MPFSNGRRWAILQLTVLLPGSIQQQIRLFPFLEKIFQPCEVKRPVRLRILSVTSFISEYDFCQNILCTTMQGVSITILTPKDNNNLSISYYIKSFPPWVVN